MTRPLEVDATRYAELPGGVPAEADHPPPRVELPPGPPDGWLGDLIQAWFEARATAGLSDHGLVAVHQDGLLAAAWRDAWTPHRSAAITALERLIEGWVGLGPVPQPGWRPVLLAVSRALAAIRAAWGAYAGPVSVVRGSRPTLLPGFRRTVA